MPEGKKSAAYVPPNGGDSVWLAGIRITVKLTSEDTGGAYAVTEEITSHGNRAGWSLASEQAPFRRVPFSTLPRDAEYKRSQHLVNRG